MRPASVLAAALFAVAPPPAFAEESVRTVVAGEQYRAPALHRWFYGSGYRDLWTTPIELPVLKLATHGGGLTPVRRVGGQQTPALAMKGGDGRAYTFRPIEKDLEGLLPDGFSDTLSAAILQDQVAAAHPAGILMVPPLAEAVGVLNTDPRLVVMPDDPSLGEFRDTFAGMTGTIDLYPGAGFGGATEVVSSERVWRGVLAGPGERIDSRAFLRARLLDLFIGDWDRHHGQWRWASVPGRPGWQPIPEDRDQAFGNYGGLVIAMARSAKFAKKFESFDGEYSIEGLAWNGRRVDRWILTDLEREEWLAIAADVQERLTDEVIDSAVRRLPPEYYAIDGPRMSARLKQRRDGLAAAAERFYDHLATHVNVRCTDRDDLVGIERFEDGDVEVRVGLVQDADGAPYYRRRFRPDETQEINVYVHDGADRVVASGPAMVFITLRVIGDAAIEDDQAGSISLEPVEPRPLGMGFGTPLSGHPSEFLIDDSSQDFEGEEREDWEKTMAPNLLFVGSPDLGVILGAGARIEANGFGRKPFGRRQRLRAGWATTPGRFVLDYDGEFRARRSGRFAQIQARVDGVDTLNFYGFGNETASETPEGNPEFFRVDSRLFTLFPALGLGGVERSGLKVSLGPELKYSDVEDDPARLVGQLQPYGTGKFGSLGLRLDVVRHPRDRRLKASFDGRFRVSGSWYPSLWDVESDFGTLEGEAAAYLRGADARVELAVRGGGRKLFGTFPWHEAAFIGGLESVRGYRRNRFAGDGSLYGNAELRFVIGRGVFFFPGEVGLFGLVDTGRVWLDDDSSGRWHTGYGGGLFLALSERSWRFSISVVDSDEMTATYFGTGIMF